MTTDEKLDKILSLLEAMASKPRASSGGTPTTLPGYGRSANQPIAGASLDDLRWYATNCQRSIEDPGKSKWHDKERAMLAALEAEIARQTGSSKTKAPAGPASGSVTEYQPPPVTDDDLPF